jgi:hypothetical protein
MTTDLINEDACLQALGLKARVARRRLEMYKRVQGIDGDLTGDQFADLLAISERATVRQKSVEWVIQHRDEVTKDILPNPPPLPSSDPGSPTEPPSARNDDDVFGVELRALRTEGQRLRADWEQLELHQKGEGVARAAWETRLRHAEEEMNALWEIVETLLEKTKLNASSQAKLERRVGYSKRSNERFQKTGRPQHAKKALEVSGAANSDPGAALETIEIRMSNGVAVEGEPQSLVGNETEVSQRSLT